MSMSIDFQTVGTPGNYDLADIPGKRVLFSLRRSAISSWPKATLSRIVTGDTINTRPIWLYDSLQVNCKIWWSMNDRPADP